MKPNRFSRRVLFVLILVTLAVMTVGIIVVQAFDIITNEFSDGGEFYELSLESEDFLYSVGAEACNGLLFNFPLGFPDDGFTVTSFVGPIRSVTSVWENHGTITKYSGACGDVFGGQGKQLACSQVMLAAQFERYSIQDISFTGNRGTASSGFYLPGVDGLVAIDNLSYDITSRTWTGTFDTSSIPAGEYSSVYLSVFNADGEQFKCLLGKFVVN